jgi:N-acetylglucosamine kinase-like BadF-type ATPase
MGGAPVLDGRRSLGLHNNEQNDGVVGRGGFLIGDAAGEERVGRTFTRRYGRQFER